MVITKQDVISGIIKLIQNGKKLPHAELIENIKNSGLEGVRLNNAIKAETERQISKLADVWFDVLVLPEKLRTKQDKEMDKERWELAINETLKVKDYYKVLDMSILAEGIERADEIIAKARAEVAKEAQDRANAEWRTISEEMTEDQKYRSALLAHWTAVRLKAGVLAFSHPSYLSKNLSEWQRNANRRMLISFGERYFPEVPKEIREENLMLFVMQYVNYQHCEHVCKGYQDCYMQAHRLGLGYNPTSKKFYVTNNSATCPKFVAAKARAKAEEQARIAKMVAMENQLRETERVNVQ